MKLLSGANEYLEAQYLKYRNHWRRVSSIHRMQAFYVENKFLNMLGLRGIMIDNISTSTLKNMSDTVQVEVSAMQYENIFEASDSFKINTIDSSAANTAKSIVSSGALSSLTPAEANSVTEISAFSKGRAAGDPVALGQFLLKVGNSTNISFASFGRSPIRVLRRVLTTGTRVNLTVGRGAAENSESARAVFEVDGVNVNRELIDQGFGRFRKISLYDQDLLPRRKQNMPSRTPAVRPLNDSHRSTYITPS